MKNNDDTLEFNEIKKQIAALCHSELSKQKITALKPYQDLDDLQYQQQYILDGMALIYAYGNVPLGQFDDIKPHLDKANKDGVLFPDELLSIQSLLYNIKEVKQYLSSNDATHSQLTQLIDLLYLPQELLDQIHHCIDPSGHIQDHASHELYTIRQRLMHLQSQIRKRIESIKAKNVDLLSQDGISSRNDHLVLPVKAGYKNQVSGIVHGHSATGRTLFIEPAEIVALNNQLASLQKDEQIEIHRILLELSRMVKRHYDILLEDCQNLTEIDYIFAISLFGKKNEMILPEVHQDYQSLVLKQAKHPLIERQQVVANDIVLQKPQNILLISGSNTGGKTVVLKTAGLLSLMAICGLPVLASEAKIPLFHDIYVDLGDEQSIEQSLSTFSSHMKRLVHITEHAKFNSLVLIDEIGSGTDPQEGQSIAQAILQYLHQKGCLVLTSTHYSGLKEYAKASDYVKVASVEFDQQAMKPTYRLIEGSVGNSYAIEISARLGLDQDIVQDAKKIKEASLTTSQRLLEKLQDELSRVQQEKDQLDELLLEAKKKNNEYNDKLNKWQSQKEQLMEEAKNEANEIIEQAKTQVSRVMKNLNEQSQLKPHQVIDAKRQLDLSKHEKEKVVRQNHHQFKIGDVVKVLSVNRQGEVMDINKKGVLTIGMGGLKINAKTNEVEFLHEKVKEKVVKSSLKPLKTSKPQGYELNIIGLRYEEAMIKVDKFIDDALVHRYSMVRIVHGMGTGVLRKGVRKLLDKNKYVVSYRDGGPNEGGLGATLVYFE